MYMSWCTVQAGCYPGAMWIVGSVHTLISAHAHIWATYVSSPCLLGLPGGLALGFGSTIVVAITWTRISALGSTQPAPKLGMVFKVKSSCFWALSGLPGNVGWVMPT